MVTVVPNTYPVAKAIFVNANDGVTAGKIPQAGMIILIK
jgi:hypothetical protein